MDDNARVARFTALFEEHYGAVLRYAQRRVDPESAADVAADVFLVAWRRLDDAPVDIVPWLLVTTRHVVANQRRSADRATALRVRLAGQRGDPVDPVETVADAVATREQWTSAFRRLAPDDQEVLALIAWDGLTVTQAARVLGCRRSAFSMRLLRARRRMRRALSGELAAPARPAQMIIVLDQEDPA